MTLEKALEQAKMHQQAGRLPEAGALCRQILAALPRQPEALHLLGIIAYQTKHFQAALDLISQAIAASAANPVFYLSQGEVHQALGQDDAAAASFERALLIDPGCAPAHFLLGVHYRHRNADKAIASYRKALALAPNWTEVHINLGAALFREGQFADATACYERAMAINPVSPEAHYNSGVVHMAQEQVSAAIACFQKAVDFQPAYASAWNNLGAALVVFNRFDEALACLERAKFLRPECGETYRNLGNVFFNTGRINSAVSCYRQAVRLLPSDAQTHSILVYALLFDPSITSQQRYSEHQEWNQRYTVPLRTDSRPFSNTPQPSRRLKIGYVSPDFRAHACGLFLVPLFEAHDHMQVEVFCYASVRHPDHITARLKACADVWRDVLALSDDELAEQIREDEIDILVDLTMHMTNNRLPLFARKPAPVQVSWLAYPGTTGLQTIDYRLTDTYLEPPATEDTGSSETALRLPDSFWCYDPLAIEPAVNDLPARITGQITFGCLNNFSKINEPVLTLWARVLMNMPESRLFILAYPGSHRNRTQEYLESQGIDPQRVQFVTNCPRPQYLELYHQVDILLDTVPYNGHTTSLDALWMGVPVVSLMGSTVVGRGGLSILSNVGLPELIAHSENEYVRIAVSLANDLPWLSELRATLRSRMQASPLMDGPKFARNMEAAYRQTWHNWCLEA